MKNKKILIIVVVLILICLLSGLEYYFIKRRQEPIKQSEKKAQITQIYENLVSNPIYKFSLTLDDKNNMIVSIKNDKANIDMLTEGEHLTKIVKDNNTYLLVHPREKYYIYQNNELELAKITSSLEKIKEKDYKKGKEEINDTKYTYEEFENYNSMMLKYAEDITEENSKTRFYFNKENKLEYIKTIWNDKEELLKVDLTYEVEDTLFDIPENFKQG